jgi:hypothetical protein
MNVEARSSIDVERLRVADQAAIWQRCFRPVYRLFPACLQATHSGVFVRWLACSCDACRPDAALRLACLPALSALFTRDSSPPHGRRATPGGGPPTARAVPYLQAHSF